MNSLKMKDVIQKVSEEYRAKRGEVSELHDELRNINFELWEADQLCGENITMAHYMALTKKRAKLEENIKIKQQFCEGIAYARELLMDFGFDVEVEVHKEV